jgi:hypothetical protein
MEAEMKIQSVKESSSFRGTLIMFAALSVAAFACAPSVPLQNRPCPCSDGWVCCPSGNVCASDESSCPATGSMTPGADSGVSSDARVQTMPTDAGQDIYIGTNPPPPADAGLPTLSNPAYTVQSSYLGTWSGYFENFTFPSKSDDIRLSIAQNADGIGKISVVLGMGTPPAPPTSAAATWPPTANASPSALGQLAGTYIEGFVYDAYEVQWDAGRLRFVINGDEPWQPYCQLQTSYYIASEARYLCTPSGGGSGSENPDGSFTCYSNGVPLSCMQAFACDELCACAAGGCGANVNNTTSFDITFTGTKGEGNVTVDTGRDVMLTQVATADGGQP